MREKKEHNNPKNVVGERGGVALPGKKSAIAEDSLTSIRYSEITSIVPDDMNWNKIYVGKKGEPQKREPGEKPRK